MVSTISIIIPPPAPKKPQIKPMQQPPAAPLTICITRLLSCMVCLGFTDGSRRNFRPSTRVMNTEKPPNVPSGTKEDSQLPTRVMLSTPHIMTKPFFRSMAPLLA